MKTTVEFLNAVKAKHHLPSDGRLAVMLGLTRASISRFQQGKDFLGDETAMKVADLLDIDPAFVVACVHAERAKRPEEKALWSSIATRASSIAAGVVFAVILSASVLEVPVLESGAYVVSTVASNIHYAPFDAVELAVFGLLIFACWLAFPRNNPRKK